MKIEPLQVWDIGPGNPKPMRKIKILAKHPEKGATWIYEEMAGGVFNSEIGRVGLFPEYNLRYMYDNGMASLCQL